MIILEVKLPDTPGSLIELIKPISNHGGNIFGIIHDHNKKVNNMIPVKITFELTEELMEHSLPLIKAKLSEKNIQIEALNLEKENRHLIVILTGHVFETDIVDTIKRLAAKDIKVAELQAKITDIADESVVKFKLDFPEEITPTELLDEINTICKEKNLFLIRS